MSTREAPEYGQAEKGAWDAESDGGWICTAFRLAIYGCVQFPLLAVLAMLVYPGGTPREPHRAGYSFFHNFFSDLGRTLACNGERNFVAATLFGTALTATGLSLAMFFVAFPCLLRGKALPRVLSLVGSVAGVVSGLAFVGVAFSPVNVLPGLHGQFVLLAFRSFLAASVVNTAAILAHPTYPRVFAWLFAGFALLLTAYIWLLTGGPRTDTEAGLLIQATGQKVIAYAAILCSLIQSLGARRYRCQRV